MRWVVLVAINQGGYWGAVAAGHHWTTLEAILWGLLCGTAFGVVTNR